MQKQIHYQTSRDYARLAELAKAGPIVCFVASKLRSGYKDVAVTIYEEWLNPFSGRAATDRRTYWQLMSAGACYATGTSADAFAEACERAGVEFIPPT